MAKYPPYMNATGLIQKILDKVIEAKTPERFTQDFLATKLNCPGGSAKAFIPLMKRLGMLATDGSPTELYKRFRNPRHSKQAMAQAIKKGYQELFARNEYIYELDRNELQGLIKEITGLESRSDTIRAICSTFEALKAYADFDVPPTAEVPKDQKDEKKEEPVLIAGEHPTLGLTYSINIVLPKTDDIAVFNAIFKSLQEHLLKQ